MGPPRNSFKVKSCETKEGSNQTGDSSTTSRTSVVDPQWIQFCHYGRRERYCPTQTPRRQRIASQRTDKVRRRAAGGSRIHSVHCQRGQGQQRGEQQRRQRQKTTHNQTENPQENAAQRPRRRHRAPQSAHSSRSKKQGKSRPSRRQGQCSSSSSSSLEPSIAPECAPPLDPSPESDVYEF